MLVRILLLAVGITLSTFAQALADEDTDWRAVDPENILYVETASGRTVFELNPDFAPNHVARLKALVRERYYDDAPFYRVIDGFVAQFGQDGEGGFGLGNGENLQPLKAELARPIDKNAPFILAQSPTFFAPETGYMNGFPVGRDPERNIEYLLNCRGAVNFARGGADTAVSHLAIMTGQAPRHLDNNITQVARVLWGMEHLLRINVGDAANRGVIEDDADRSRVVRLQIAADVPEDEQTMLMVMRTETEAFQAVLEGSRFRDRDEWFVNPTAHVVDVCYYPAPVKLAE